MYRLVTDVQAFGAIFLIRSYLSKMLLQAMAEVMAFQPTDDGLDIAALESFWRRPRQACRGHLAINVRTLIADSTPGFDPAITCADLAAAMLAIDVRQPAPFFESLEASDKGFLNCRLNAHSAARALSATFSLQALTESITAPPVLALPANYARCQAYLRHAREGATDILAPRLMPAMLSASEWASLEERWRSDPEVFLPLFTSSDTASVCFDLIMHLDDFDPGSSRARIKAYLDKSALLLDRFFASFAADKGFFCDHLSVSKARLGLIFAVMHVSLVGLGIMHLAADQ